MAARERTGSNPPEWTREEVLEFPGSADGPWARYVHETDDHGVGTVRCPRLVPREAEAARQLAKRKLTDDEILAHLLALYLERAASEKKLPRASVLAKRAAAESGLWQPYCVIPNCWRMKA